MYGLEQGPTETTILKQAARYGTPIPRAIQQAPELWKGLEIFYQAFLDLASSRPMGMYAVGPIPTLAMMEYCALQGIEADQKHATIWLLSRLDQRYLEWINAKSATTSSGTPKRG